jgi:hypothetical protein
MAKKKKDKENFFKTSMCQSQDPETCKRCRLFKDYRKVLDDMYDIPGINRRKSYTFDCPNGKVPSEFEETEHPTALSMLKSLGQAAVDQVKHVKKGNKGIATKKEQARRIEICKGCNLYLASRHRCKKCGCKLPVKIKGAGQKCPIGKWGPEN